MLYALVADDLPQCKGLPARVSQAPMAGHASINHNSLYIELGHAGILRSVLVRYTRGERESAYSQLGSAPGLHPLGQGAHAHLLRQG